MGFYCYSLLAIESEPSVTMELSKFTGKVWIWDVRVHDLGQSFGVWMGVAVWLRRLGFKHVLMGLGRIALCTERRDWMLQASALQVLWDTSFKGGVRREITICFHMKHENLEALHPKPYRVPPYPIILKP